jgi:hypothetical protein
MNWYESRMDVTGATPTKPDTSLGDGFGYSVRIRSPPFKTTSYKSDRKRKNMVQQSSVQAHTARKTPCVTNHRVTVKVKKSLLTRGFHHTAIQPPRYLR